MAYTNIFTTDSTAVPLTYTATVPPTSTYGVEYEEQHLTAAVDVDANLGAHPAKIAEDLRKELAVELISMLEKSGAIKIETTFDLSSQKYLIVATTKVFLPKA